MPAILRMAEQDHGTRGTWTGLRGRGEDHHQRLALLDEASAAELRAIESAGSAILAANPLPHLPEEAEIEYSPNWPVQENSNRDAEDYELDMLTSADIFGTADGVASLDDMFGCEPWSRNYYVAPSASLFNPGSFLTRSYR